MKLAAIIFLWVIHVAALIGIAAGYASFFLPQSPWTMLYLLLLLVIFFRIDSPRKLSLLIGFFLVGMTVEWLGVHTSLLFGEYKYLDNFGPKIDGIPLLIGVNWALLTFCTYRLSQGLSNNIFVKSILAASLMVVLDFFLEQVCEYAGFWLFTDGAGWFNYLCWLVIAFVLQLIINKFRVKGDFQISLHLYIVQLVFTATLWILISTI
jgi:putative membrane protein